MSEGIDIWSNSSFLTSLWFNRNYKTPPIEGKVADIETFSNHKKGVSKKLWKTKSPSWRDVVWPVPDFKNLTKKKKKKKKWTRWYAYIDWFWFHVRRSKPKWYHGIDI